MPLGQRDRELLAACRRSRRRRRLRFLLAAGRLSRIARRAARGGGAVSRRLAPVRRRAPFGECGGYMALRRKPRRRRRAPAHPMAGLLSVKTSFAKRRMTLGYREARLASKCALGAGRAKCCAATSSTMRRSSRAAGDEAFAHVRRRLRRAACARGLAEGRVTGSFFHVIAES